MIRFASVHEQSLKQKNKLLESIRIMQGDFLRQGIYYGWCKNTLNNLLCLSESKFGFICELLQKKDGTPFIRSHGISNIAWDEKSRLFYEKHYKNGLEFFNFSSLWGNAITKGEAVIANDPNNDFRQGGYPKEDGHPPLEAFLGLPIKGASGKVVGVMGVANRPNGYDHDIVDFLDPFISTYGILIEKSQIDKQRKKLEEEKEKLIKKLSNAISEIKTLRGILPLCSFCKKIKNDKGYWEQVDVYIHKHSEADISHSICPACMKKHYPDEYERIFCGKTD